MVKKLHVGAALLAGVVATGAMTLLMYMAPLMGLPKMDLLFALGSLFPGRLSPYIFGAIVHVGIGSAPRIPVPYGRPCAIRAPRPVPRRLIPVELRQAQGRRLPVRCSRA